MAEVQLENMGVGGILRDREAYTIPPEYWSGGQNVRFINGEAVKVLGEEEIYPTWGLPTPLTGTITATGSSQLIDTGVDFAALGVVVGWLQIVTGKQLVK